MLRLIGIAITVGLADSMNPTTIVPAIYLAAGSRRPRTQVIEFTLAVFLVYLAGGVILALGPGQLLLSLVPHPSRHVRYLLELIVGVVMLVIASFLGAYRQHLSGYKVPEADPERRSSMLLGAGITAVELPTAFPYFAVIAAIVGADVDPVREVIVLVIFNAAFVLPLLLILATLTFAGPRSTVLLVRGRRWLEARWPLALATLLLLAGTFVTVLGITGLASAHHPFFRRVHHFFLHP